MDMTVVEVLDAPSDRLHDVVLLGARQLRLVEVVPAHPNDVVEAVVALPEILPVGARLAGAVVEKDLKERARLDGIEQNGDAAPGREAEDGVDAGEVRLVGPRDIEAVHERPNPVEGAGVPAPARSVSGDQIDPERVEALLLAVREEGRSLGFGEIDHQRLRRVTRDQEGVAVLVDEVAAALADAEGIRRARRRVAAVLERGELGHPAGSRLPTGDSVAARRAREALGDELPAPARPRLESPSESLDGRTVGRSAQGQQLRGAARLEGSTVELRGRSGCAGRRVERLGPAGPGGFVDVQRSVPGDRSREAGGDGVRTARDAAGVEDLRPEGTIAGGPWTDRRRRVPVAVAVRQEHRPRVVPHDEADDRVPRLVGPRESDARAAARGDLAIALLDERARRSSLRRSDEQRGARERNAERERQERQTRGLRHGAVTIAHRRLL